MIERWDDQPTPFQRALGTVIREQRLGLQGTRFRGYGMRGFGAVTGNGTVTDAARAGDAALAALDSLDSAVRSAQQAVQSASPKVQVTGIASASSDLQDVANAISGLASQASPLRAKAQQIVSYYGPARGGNFGAVPPTPMDVSGQAMNDGNAIEAQAQALAGQVNQTASRIAAIVQAAQVAAQQAQAAAAQKAQADAQAAATNSRNAVLQAITTAQAQSASGGFDAALATLQNPNVVNAAASVSMTGDLQSAIAAVGSMARAAQAQRDQATQRELSAQQAQADAAQRAAAERDAVARQAQAQIDAASITSQNQLAIARMQEESRQAQLAREAALADRQAEIAAEERRASREASARHEETQTLLQLIQGLGPLGQLLLPQILARFGIDITPVQPQAAPAGPTPSDSQQGGIRVASTMVYAGEERF